MSDGTEIINTYLSHEGAKPESTITSSKSRASNLIVLVESEIKHKILHKNIELEAIFKKIMRQENDCFATRYLSRNR